MAGTTFLAVAAVALTALAGCTSTPTDTHDHKDAYAALHAAYNDKPYKGGQATPMHEWLEMDDGRLLFIHWNTDNPADATGVLWVGDGFKAKGCIGIGGVSQAQIDAGYVHFHKETSDNWDRAHHTVSSAPNTMGYWLRHIQVDPMASTGGTPPPSPVGEVYPLMDSTGNAPACSLV